MRHLKKDIRWKTNIFSVTRNVESHEDHKPAAIDFESPQSPYSFFCKYFTDDFYQAMVDFTNLYAVQQGKRFVLTTTEEIKIFVGIHVLMGNLHYPRIKFYWDSKLKIAQISVSMPLNRFYSLRQNRHFVNIEERVDDQHRFWKVRPSSRSTAFH